ncbi:hypothetical protein HHI36_014161 [Cryptolaemus montrouzieri]|uniref:Uncharacterized protein n=1 Tax=Cryptolaemus montrouzieri TaxID=559131 RepID=A0ABD2N2Q7_9CUCU
MSSAKYKNLTPNLIAKVLNDSEFDYSGDESDEDSEFEPPKTKQTVRDHRKSGSSSSNEDEDDLVVSVPSPASLDNSVCSSTSSYLPRARGRSRRTSSGQSRRRSSGRSDTHNYYLLVK